jgi:hypothetical protein
MSASGKFGVGLVASLALAGGAMGQIDCSAGCANPATVDNGAFSVEFLGAVEQAPYITFAYTVCQLDTGALPRFQPELSHWNLGLAQIDCFLEGKGMVDLVVGATLDGAPTVFDVNTDPTTGVTGIKWDEGVDDRGCHTWTVTFDTSVLLENFTLVPGCAIVATKAGQQVAYACGVGPICVDPPAETCWTGETAWSAGTRYVTRGNWATYTRFTGETIGVTLFAGQTMPAGTVTFDPVQDTMVEICVTLDPGFRFDPDTDESLKIQGYATAPSGNPSPGLFAHKFDAESSPYCVVVPRSAFFGVHVDVEREICVLSEPRRHALPAGRAPRAGSGRFHSGRG